MGVNHQVHTLIELDDGKIYRKTLYLMVKTMVSCRFSLKPIHWYPFLHGHQSTKRDQSVTRRASKTFVWRRPMFCLQTTVGCPARSDSSGVWGGWQIYIYIYVYIYMYIYIYVHILYTYIIVTSLRPHCDLTATSLGIMVSKGNHPQMALIQLSDFFKFTHKYIYIYI